MKSFRQYLIEARFQEIVHHDPSMSTLKTIAKNNKHGSVRFVIDKEDKLHAGDSLKFTHHDIYPAMHTKVRGYVTHMGGDDYTYTSSGPFDNHPQQHPMFQRFEKAGIKNGRE